MIQYLSTISRRPVQPCEASINQQVEDQPGVSVVILLTTLSEATNLSGVADPDWVSEVFNQLLKPGAVAAGF